MPIILNGTGPHDPQPDPEPIARIQLATLDPNTYYTLDLPPERHTCTTSVLVGDVLLRFDLTTIAADTERSIAKLTLHALREVNGRDRIVGSFDATIIADRDLDEDAEGPA